MNDQRQEMRLQDIRLPNSGGLEVSPRERSGRRNRKGIHSGATCDRLLGTAGADASLSLEDRIPDRREHKSSSIQAGTC
jgi:hypothetical protein